MDVHSLNIRIHLTFVGNWVVRFSENDSLQSSLQPQCRQLVKYFAHKLCFLIAHVLHWSIVHEAATAFQTWRSQSSFSVNLPWTACGFVCNVSISLSFPAPTSSTDLNSNNDKTYKVTPMIESLLNDANSRLQVRNPFWVFQGVRRRGTKSIRARVRARENNMKPFVRTSFLGTRPSCHPSPGRPFFCTDDRKPNLWLGLPGSPVKRLKIDILIYICVYDKWLEISAMTNPYKYRVC